MVPSKEQNKEMWALGRENTDRDGLLLDSDWKNCDLVNKGRIKPKDDSDLDIPDDYLLII